MALIPSFIDEPYRSKNSWYAAFMQTKNCFPPVFKTFRGYSHNMFRTIIETGEPRQLVDHFQAVMTELTQGRSLKLNMFCFLY